MASGGRRSKLQALVFDLNIFNLRELGLPYKILYFTPEFMRKNQRPNQVNDPWYIPVVQTGRTPWYIPVVQTGKPEFRAPNFHASI